MKIIRWRYVVPHDYQWNYAEPGDDKAVDEFILGLRSGHGTPIQIQVLIIIRDETK